jgi:hypothetical protein
MRSLQVLATTSPGLRLIFLHESTVLQFCKRFLLEE